jgi:hypothetical protein
MTILRKTEVQFDRRTDPFWWGLAAALGLVSLWLPQLLHSPDRTTQVVLVECALFFSGALIGSLRPERAWRWGLAAFLAIAFKDIALSGKEVAFAWLASAAGAAYLVDNLPLYLAYSAPVLGGAYVGSYLTRGPIR